MRICLYTETALPKLGGQEMVVDALARQFQGLGHEVVVLAPHPRLPLRARDESLPYPIVRHPRFFSTRYFVAWYRWWLLRLHRRFPFDILHCHGLYPPAYLASLCRDRLRAPVLVTSHGGDVFEKAFRQSRPVIARRQRHGVQSADALVSISRFTDEGFLRWGARPEQIHSIPNGVDWQRCAARVDRPADLPPGVEPGNYVLFLGRLKKRKAVDVLLDAWSRLPRDNNLQLVIGGDGEERDPLGRQAHSLDVDDHVCFLGAVFGDKKSYLLQNARCTAVPSRTWEAFGLVVLESFAAGTPVIATTVPGLGDLVEPGKTGWLVPPEDPSALADALRQACGDAGECRVRGSRAAVLAAEFSWTRVAQRHLELYESLLGRRARLAA